MQGVARDHRGHRDGVELLLRRLARTIDEPLSVPGKRERGHAILRVGELPRFAAVRTHQVQLERCSPARSPHCRGIVRRARSGGGQGARVRRRCGTRGRPVTIGKKREILSVARPRGIRLALVRRECQPPGARNTLLRGYEVDVALAPRFLPVGSAHCVEHPPAIRTRSGCTDLLQVLHVEPGHGARDALRGEGRGGNAEREEERGTPQVRTLHDRDWGKETGTVPGATMATCLSMGSTSKLPHVQHIFSLSGVAAADGCGTSCTARALCRDWSGQPFVACLPVANWS